MIRKDYIINNLDCAHCAAKIESEVAKMPYVKPVSYTHLNTVTVDGQIIDGAQIVTEQFVPMGPAASQIAIKQTGTTGGGYMGVNSAHPLENPNPFTNLIEMISLLLIPAALCFTFGMSIKNKKQGVAIFMACLLYTSRCV